ncbi:hypothetical protein POM88_051375 [Heracleum sosnowskyi]|uniref:Uncharacterized protein n=1 Tax=Heracleum sosnowskyi TaxID=360622 RepID=A0AAD8H0B6_9APIA|nr:hypothetical protein POM88_051375 [Heracleum sosnowskyi]
MDEFTVTDVEIEALWSSLRKLQRVNILLLVTDSLYGYEGQARGDEGDTSVSHDYWDTCTWEFFRVLASLPDVRTCLGINGYADSAVDRLWQKKRVEIIFVIY